MNYKHIKYFFDTKLWTEEMVRTAVKKGIITREQFKTIIGVEY